ncbi:MAG: hypothetical protein AB1560_11600 [Pseudomonadota bacterium]
MAIKTGQGGEMRIVLTVRDDGTAVIEKFGKTAERGAEDISAGWKKAGVVVGALAVTAATTAAVMIKNQIDIADATGKTAEKLGTTAEAVSALTYVASLADVSAQELANSLQFMNRNLSDAAKGTGEARFAIKDLGLNAQELKNMRPEEAMFAIAAALEKIPSQADRAAIAADIFNDRTGKMLNVLRGGPDVIRANMAEAERFGKVISTETARAAEEFNDNITRLKANLDGMALSVLPPLLKKLNELTGEFNEGIRLAGGFWAALTAFGTINPFKSDAKNLESIRLTLEAATRGEIELTDEYRKKLELQKKFLEYRQREAALALNAGGDQGREGRLPTTIPGGGGVNSRAQEEAAKKIAQEQEKLAQEILEIHRATLSEQIRAAEEYVERYNKLERARAIGVITSDQELAERRLELAAQYEAQLAELNKPEQTSAEKLKEELTARGVAIAESYQSEAEQLRLKKENELAIINEAEIRGIELGIEYDVLREQIKTEHETRMGEIEARELEKRYGQAGRFAAAMQKLWKQGATGQLQVTQTLFGELAGLMQSKHKSMFDIGKKAALAQATLSMFSSIAAALETKPFFPLGLAMGAIATAKGIANISAIKSTEFGSSNATGTFNASPSSGLPSTGGLSDIGGPALTPSPIAPIAPERSLNLFLNGTDVYSPENIRDRLLPAIKEAWGEGVRFNVSIAY